jgi:hypothetical protein
MRFEIIDITRISLQKWREKHGMALPDAIILATAQSRAVGAAQINGLYRC